MFLEVHCRTGSLELAWPPQMRQRRSLPHRQLRKIDLGSGWSDRLFTAAQAA